MTERRAEDQESVLSTFQLPVRRTRAFSQITMLCVKRMSNRPDSRNRGGNTHQRDECLVHSEDYRKPMSIWDCAKGSRGPCAMEPQTKAPQQKNNSYKKQRRSTRGDFPVACTVIFNPMPHAGTNAQQLGLCGEFIQSCVFVNEQVEDKTDFQTKTNDE